MRIFHSNGIYTVQIRLGEASKPLKRAGFVWHEHSSTKECQACRAGLPRSSEKWSRWWTPFATKALALIEEGAECDPDTRAAIDAGVAKAKEADERRTMERIANAPAVAASQAVEPVGPIDVPLPEGRVLQPLQSAAVEYAAGKDDVVLADEDGCGKRVQALAIINSRGAAANVLIITDDDPEAWAGLARDWLVGNPEIEVRPPVLPANVPVVVLSFSDVRKKGIADSARVTSWQALIVDDASALRSPSSQQTQAILWGPEAPGIASSAALRLFIMRGDIFAKPEQLQPLLAFIDPRYRNRQAFIGKYCHTEPNRYGPPKILGLKAEALPALEEELRGLCMLRRRLKPGSPKCRA
jgi:SWI/SNF-related matrix-associated actin-dependent regulator 1 of chromatin subfamily A